MGLTIKNLLRKISGISILKNLLDDFLNKASLAVFMILQRNKVFYIIRIVLTILCQKWPQTCEFFVNSV